MYFLILFLNNISWNASLEVKHALWWWRTYLVMLAHLCAPFYRCVCSRVHLIYFSRDQREIVLWLSVYLMCTVWIIWCSLCKSYFCSRGAFYVHGGTLSRTFIFNYIWLFFLSWNMHLCTEFRLSSVSLTTCVLTHLVIMLFSRFTVVIMYTKNHCNQVYAIG